MNKFLLLGLALSFQSVFSQVSMSGRKLSKDGQTYKISKYEQVFDKTEARNYFKKGRSNKTFGDILGTVGGFGMGFTLGQIISSPKETKVEGLFGTTYVYKTDNSARWTVFGISAGIALASIPFYLGAKKNFDKAIQTENGESTAFQPYFKVETAENGLALSYNF
ncbi:hypothetical protein [Kaistella carnis]|uniref:Uncharacterized protein n=1 Tax=Kaistella carnis TaxID=1241979 RepID=A0A3G8XM81_9FLAO|nr:hypothetical protein [Kaistella carnis]AZI33663.1 hypothetical protein EIB73_10920 [Kaistella carnis]